MPSPQSTYNNPAMYSDYATGQSRGKEPLPYPRSAGSENPPGLAKMNTYTPPASPLAELYDTWGAMPDMAYGRQNGMGPSPSNQQYDRKNFPPHISPEQYAAMLKGQQPAPVNYADPRLLSGNQMAAAAASMQMGMMPRMNPAAAAAAMQMGMFPPMAAAVAAAAMQGMATSPISDRKMKMMQQQHFAMREQMMRREMMPLNSFVAPQPPAAPARRPAQEDPGQGIRSPLLEEFRNNKNKKYELRVRVGFSVNDRF